MLDKGRANYFELHFKIDLVFCKLELVKLKYWVLQL